MLKLLTKFKTQSLNEVKPYENDGSLVAFCGEVRNNDDGVPDHSWPQDVVKRGLEPDEINSGPKNNQTSLSSTCFISRLPNELVRTYQLPTEVPFECENKENGTRTSEKRRTGAGLSAEKRKWSEVKNSRSSLQQGNDSSSSDEEVKELFSKQQRSDHSGNLKENRQQKPVRSGKVRPCERKRHRLTSEENRVYNRPSLDFEKMQQKVFWKKSSYATSRARIVRVQSFSGHAHNLLPHPSVMSFKPIQVIQAFKLTPVEEPRALAF